MSTRTNLLPANVYAYVLRTNARARSARGAARRHRRSAAQRACRSAADQGALMALLVRLIGAKRCLELGTYTGYSALAGGARAADGRQSSSRATSAPSGPPSAEPFWRKAGVADRIDLRLGPGLDTLDAAARGRRGGRASTSRSSTPTSRTIAAYYERLLQTRAPRRPDRRGQHAGALGRADHRAGLRERAGDAGVQRARAQRRARGAGDADSG